MKKCTLPLIGLCLFVLQSATANITLYSDNFEGQVVGNAPQNIGGGNAGNGTDPGGDMWNWVGGGGNGVDNVIWQTADVLDRKGSETHALQFGWTDLGNAGSWGFGFSTQAHTSLAPTMCADLSGLVLSFDILVSGTEFASATAPIKIWFDQFPGGVETFDASYAPAIATDGTWNHVEFTLDMLSPSSTSGAFNSWWGFEFAFVGDTARSLGGDTANIQIDNILLFTPIPEPGTITLLTLGGLGALVAIRRRRA